MRAPDGVGAAALAGAGRRARRVRPGRDVAALGAGAPADPRQHGVSFNVYGDPRGLERPWPLDPVPVRAGARRVRGARRGAGAAGDAARPAARRPLRAAAHARRGAAAARGVPGAPGPPARLRRAGAAGRALPALLRRRSRCARPTGALRVLADRTQAPAGRGLRAREPDRARARAARGVPRLQRAAAGAVLPHAARDAGGAGAARARQPAHRAADRRAAQRDLLRAGVPGAVPRLPAGRGRRSDRARRARLPEDAGRAAPGRRDPAPRSTTTTAIRWSCARLAAGRARAAAGGARRETSTNGTR